MSEGVSEFPVRPGEVVRPVGRRYALIVEKVVAENRCRARIYGTRIDYSEEKGCTNTRREKHHSMDLWAWGGRLYTDNSPHMWEPKISREVVKDFIRRSDGGAQLEIGF